MHLYLIRHPRPQEVGGLCYGRRDVRVGNESLVRAVGSVRAHFGICGLDRARIFSSPSMRCLLLARELAAPREPTVAEDLMEMDFGSWEGQTWDSVPRDQLDAWADDIWHYRPGGAESAGLMADRWLRWFTWWRASGTGNAVAVTHAGVIRVALCCSGMLSTAAFSRAVIDYGSVHCIDAADERVRA